MIDFHTHILPGIDDGCRNIEEACSLLNMLEQQGVDTVVLTPHYYGRRSDVSNFLEKRTVAFEKLKAHYRGNIRFVLGCECNIVTCVNSNFSELIPLSIGNTSYILIELSFDRKWSNMVWQRLESLIDLGLIPIIAHVELYPEVKRQPGVVKKLVDYGCLIQINCDSVLDKKLYSLVKALITHKQVHCLGSDAHNMFSRIPHYSDANEKIQKLISKNAVIRLQQDMKGILNNHILNLQTSVPVSRTVLGQYR